MNYFIKNDEITLGKSNPESIFSLYIYIYIYIYIYKCHEFFHVKIIFSLEIYL